MFKRGDKVRVRLGSPRFRPGVYPVRFTPHPGVVYCGDLVRLIYSSELVKDRPGPPTGPTYRVVVNGSPGFLIQTRPHTTPRLVANAILASLGVYGSISPRLARASTTDIVSLKWGGGGLQALLVKPARRKRVQKRR